MNKTELSPFPPSGGISVKDCNLWYGDFQALKEISMEIPEKQITAAVYRPCRGGKPVGSADG